MNRWSIGAACGAAVVAVGAMLPWVSIGPRRVSGFDLVTIARHFGHTRSTAGLLGTLWLCVPLLAGTAVAATLLGRSRWAVTLGGIVALAGAVASAATAKAAGSQTLPGVWVTAAGALAVAACIPPIYRGHRARTPSTPQG